MSELRIELPRHEHAFIGTWHIYAMEMWDESYFNMEVQAFIAVRPENLGSFQFGLVSGGLDDTSSAPDRSSGSSLRGKATTRWIRQAAVAGCS